VVAGVRDCGLVVSELVARTIAAIGALDESAMAAARERQLRLTKPPGSLGRLEELAIQLAGVTGNPLPAFSQRAIIVMAADHGVTEEGVSAYPAAVTAQMVANILAGGAAISVLARAVGARVVVVDIGVRSPLASHEQLRARKIRGGTANFSRGPALTRAEAIRAIEVGIEVVLAESARGLDLVAIGDMGIGNTSAASAIVTCFTGASVNEVTGQGTGIDDATRTRKIEAITRAIATNSPDPSDALDVLAKVGGLEVGGLAGVVLGAASMRIPSCSMGSSQARQPGRRATGAVVNALLDRRASLGGARPPVRIGRSGVTSAARPRPQAGRGHWRRARDADHRSRAPCPRRDGYFRGRADLWPRRAMTHFSRPSAVAVWDRMRTTSASAHCG
jgi:nicotinate-nucleotide--dimethylbenzimidazole phosphoribosyltransferase